MAFFINHRYHNVFCPYLKGTSMGIRCECANQYLKDIRGVDSRICSNGRYEACHIYLLSLRNITSEQIKSLQLSQAI
ncbi:MAG: hypothetical protein N2738_04110 [Thermodesulfovibrionales bacterium]|nr:hypothetical protein [Thermodesulfovibrionales bacterium]